MGKFDPRIVTHLILDASCYTSSNKYDNWKKHVELGTDWAVELKVVTSGWVVKCDEVGRRVDEGGYSLHDAKDGSMNNDNDNGGNSSNGNGDGQQQQRTLPRELQTATLLQKCDWISHHIIQHQQAKENYCHLFSRQSFILVGFDDDNHNYDANGNTNGTNNGSSDGMNNDVEQMRMGEQQASNNNDENEAAAIIESSRLPGASNATTTFNNNSKKKQHSCSEFIHANEHTTLQAKLSKLIRSAGGTIYWEPNEWISIVLLNEEGYDKETW